MKSQHQPDRKRFTLPTTPTSILSYELTLGRVDFTHTIVPAEHCGSPPSIGVQSSMASHGSTIPGPQRSDGHENSFGPLLAHLVLLN